MLALAIPIVIASATGLAYLAVVHPALYGNLHEKLLVVFALVFTALVVWVGSFSWAHATLVQFIQAEKQDAAKAAIEATTVGLPWLLVSYLVVLGYLHFLNWLARQIEQDKS